MNKLRALADAYKAWIAAHPWWAGLVVVVESALVGTLTDLIVNGVDFQGKGVRHALTVVGSSIALAVRNYLKQSPLTPKGEGK